MEYMESIEKSLEALRAFRDEVNDHLPDTPNGTDCWFDWDWSDAEYIGRCIDRVVNAVLSTKIADHVTCEFLGFQNAYTAAMKKRDIASCQRALNRANKEVCMAGNALLQTKKILA